VAATAKRDLEPGEALDGEGGYQLWSRLVRASDSRAAGMLPIGLAHGVKLKNRVAKDQPVRWADVDLDESQEAVRVRREMERRFAEQATAS
jgi:predicted homoserine dehydrogenase-like protein